MSLLRTLAPAALPVSLLLVAASPVIYGWLRSKLCGVFGHKMTTGWQGGPKYMHVSRYAIDGLNTEHAHCTCECRYCGKDFLVGKIHLPKRQHEIFLEAQLKVAKAKLSAPHLAMRAYEDGEEGRGAAWA